MSSGFFSDGSSNAISSKQSIKTIVSNNQTIVCIIERCSKSSANYVTKYIKENDIIFVKGV